MSRYSSRAALRQFWQAAQSVQSGVSRQGLYWLLRSGLVAGRTEPGGFLLPTVTLLLLMVSLVVGMLVYRTFTRTSQVIGQRQQRVLYNAATPAIEVGKSKIEYAFTQQLKPLPSDGDIASEFRLDAYNLPVGYQGAAEIRLDINNDGVLDNAWLYTTDADGDGDTERVAYSLLTQARGFDDLNGNGIYDSFQDTNANGSLDWVDGDADGVWDSGEGEQWPYEAYTIDTSAVDTTKADNLVVRNGPLIATKASNNNCPSNTAQSPIAGWEREATNTSKLRKALQVHAVVLNGNGVAATMEFQQDRQIDYGNKWGAWFRYDMGNWPGDMFRFSGAMHTDGSFILGDDKQAYYLISSPDSCVFEKDASEITMAEQVGNDGTITFQGQFMNGRTYTNTSENGDKAIVHYFNGTEVSNYPKASGLADKGAGYYQEVARATDSIVGNEGTTIKPGDVILNPVALFTGSVFESLGSDRENDGLRDADWAGEAVVTKDRIRNQNVATPFLDDTYRADDRWGPSAAYKNPGTDADVSVSQTGICYYPADESTAATCGTIGGDIPGTLSAAMLAESVPVADLNESSFGLDGYWERRARRYGVRIIVGQRLELGNPEEWLYEDTGNPYLSATVTDGDADGNGTPGEETDVIDANLRSNWGDGLDSVTGTGDYEYDEDRNGNGFLDIDPLYPPGYAFPAAPGFDATLVNDSNRSSMSNRYNELQQMRTLRDNLAAAQATAIYHYQANGGNYPVACLATTAHPGTATTDQNSRTFNYDIDTDGDGSTDTDDGLNTDFFTGKGTNGLEFAPPFAGNGATFATEFDDIDSPLRLALSNLAYFAGDPEGAFPPTQNLNSTSTTTHPYPLLTMWGNYSELRRVLDSGTAYADLSIADQSTVHTATCTIGMLAYSLQNFDAVASQQEDMEIDQNDPRIASQIDSIIEDINDQLGILGDPGGPWQSLGSRAEILLNGKAGTGQGSTGNLTWATTSPTDCPASAYNSNQTELNAAIDRDQNGSPDFCISLENWANGLVPGYNETAVTPKDDSSTPTVDESTIPYPWSTDPNSAATRFIKDYGAEFYHSFTFEDWSNAQIPGDNTIAELSGILNGTNQLSVEVTLLSSGFDPRRDRLWGFSPGTSGRDILLSIDQGSIDFDSDRDPPPTLNYNWDESTGLLTPPSGTPTEVEQFKTGCNPLLFTDLFPSNNSINDAVQLGLIGIASVLCGEFDDAKFTFRVTTGGVIRYPSLYYLFPLAAHYHNGSFTADSLNGSEYSSVAAVADDEGIEIEEANQRVGDPYAIDPYITNIEVNGTTAVKYRPVEDGLKDCATVACSVGTRDGVADDNGADDDRDTPNDNETIDKFVTYLGIAPRTTASDWQTPLLTGADVTDTNFATNRHLIKVNGVNWQPAIIDMALYNGRELMSVRTLSLDLNQMRQKAPGNSACSWENPTADTNDSNGDCWLPLPTILEPYQGSTTTGALIYAFREDAVREDAIARPQSTNQTCATMETATTGWLARWRQFVKADATGLTNITLAGYLMNAAAAPASQQDPQVNPCTGVSPKPVDFYPDPGRRPHGFVLQNGEDLRRGDGTTWDQDDRGISFVSDQPVYIWGDFNLHSTAGTVATRIEEFTTLLAADWNNFYTRTAATLNTNFSRSSTDTWRPSEIVADTVTILSSYDPISGEGFKPGYIADGLTWKSGTSTLSSYGAMPILRNNDNPASGSAAAAEVGKDQAFILEDSNIWGKTYPTSTSVTSPIKLSHRGFPLIDSSGTTVEYGVNDPTTQFFEIPDYGCTDTSTDSDSCASSYDTVSSRSRMTSPTTTQYANAIVVAAAPPARAYQPNGQIANHLRFIENWSGDLLNFQGSLFQLNFAVYSGPHDQDSWEPRMYVEDSAISYYVPPDRSWGFDVGLLYAPPGAIAERMAVPSLNRSEFYREPAVDDVYVMNLRCAWVDNDASGILEADEKVDGNRVDSSLTTTECPAP